MKSAKPWQEIPDSVLKLIAGNVPGNFALYQFHAGQLKTFARSAGLPSLSGLSPEEYDKITAEDASAIIFPSDLALVQQRLGEALKQGNEVNFTYRIYNKKMGAAWVHGISRILGLHQGDPVILTVFHATSSEEEESIALLSHTSTLIYVVDKYSYEILYANDAACKSFGVLRPYSTGHCYEIINQEKKPCSYCPIAKMKKGVFHSGNWYSSTKKKYYDLSCRDMDWHGRKAIAVFSHDVTAAKRKERSLELDKKDLKTIIDSIPVGVGVVELKDHKLFTSIINSKLTSLLGMNKADFVSNNPAFLARVHPEDRAQLKIYMSNLFVPGEYENTFRFRRNEDSPYRYFHAAARSVYDEGIAMVFICLEDVSQEKEANASALRGWSIYQSAIKEAALTAWEYDFASNSAYLATGNPTNLSLLMKDNARILKDLPTSLFPYLAPESFETVKQFYSQVRSGSPSCSCEIWFLDRQGGGRHCEKLSMTTVYDENKQPLRAYGIGQDITAEKTKEEKFNEALLALDEAHPFTLGSVRLNFTRDKVEDFRGINPSILSEHAQGSVHEYFQAFATLIADPLTQETFLRESEPAVLLKAFHEGKTRFSIEYPALGPKGVTLWREALLFLIENPNSGDIEGVTYAIDITERKKNEAIIAHLTSQEFDYIALIDSLEGTIEFENKQSNITFGAVFEPKPYEEWRKYLESHFLNPQELENYQNATAINTIVAELANKNEYVFSYDQFENGVRSRRQLQYSWLDKNRGLIISLRKDITASYEQDQNQMALLRVALNKAEAANAAKTEFLSRISHDIRTPISIITNMTAFAFEDIDQKDKLKDDLRKIETSNTFLLSLINDVLDISKIDAGKIELHLEPYAFDNYVSVIRNMFVDVCKSKGLEFTVETEGEPAPIMTDHIRLNQITLNLLSNAVKYTPKGGKILFRAGSRPQADGNLACRIEVKDNGIGMSPDFQKQLFQAFSQDYDNPYRNKASSGTGLGLAIVKRLVDLIGGKITVKSELGKGSDFVVTFVAKPAPIEALTPDGKVLGGKSGNLSGTLLLAEDNDINAIIAERILSSFNVKSVRAHDGLEAVELFKASRPGDYFAILMDIQMPKLNGYEATEAIRALDRPDAKRVPIIAMTADAFSLAQEKSYRSGMNDYVTKPLDPTALEQALLRIKK